MLFLGRMSLVSWLVMLVTIGGFSELSHAFQGEPVRILRAHPDRDRCEVSGRVAVAVSTGPIQQGGTSENDEDPQDGNFRRARGANNASLALKRIKVEHSNKPGLKAGVERADFTASTSIESPGGFSDGEVMAMSLVDVKLTAQVPNDGAPLNCSANGIAKFNSKSDPSVIVETTGLQPDDQTYTLEGRIGVDILKAVGDDFQGMMGPHRSPVCIFIQVGNSRIVAMHVGGNFWHFTGTLCREHENPDLSQKKQVVDEVINAHFFPSIDYVCTEVVTVDKRPELSTEIIGDAVLEANETPGHDPLNKVTELKAMATASFNVENRVQD